MKFNLLTRKKNQVINYEGAKATKLSPEMELYSAVVTSGLGNQFYTSEREKISRIRSLITQVDPVFVAKLAIYARNSMNLRSIPLVLIAELAKVHQGDSLVSNAVTKTIKRADEITELLSCYALANQRNGYKKLNKLSKQIQKGLGNSFNRFDEYQFAKYDRQTEITIKDALFLVRPKAISDAQQVLFDKIAEDKLSTPYTWEVELSKLGQSGFASEVEKAEAFRSKWEELIASKKLGYMALLRNIRNITEAGVRTSFIEIVGNRLRNKEEVLKSKQLPFRFLAAYREMQSVKNEFTSYFLDCIEEAAKHSMSNVKGFDLNTRILIASDVSGSMYSNISARSKIRYYDIGLLLGMLMNSKSNNVITGIFGDRWKTISLPSNQILANTQLLDRIEGSVGYSTNGYKVIESLIKKRKVIDKVMMFTDCQMWDSTGYKKSIQRLWIEYKATIAPGAKLYLFDLSGYGNTPLKVGKNDVYLIAGWSDKIFDVLKALENGESTLSQIKSIELNSD